jgi:3-phenylpropionate/cinnamic acid dioxygenase small subunit
MTVTDNPRSSHGARRRAFSTSVVGRPSSVVRADSPEYADILDFLYREAELLDAWRFEEWLTLLTEDIVYRMPARLTTRNRNTPGFSDATAIFNDNLASLRVRVARFGTSFAWAEDPPSRTRHFVTNVRVNRSEHSNELDVRANLLLYRVRADQPVPDIFSGERHDILRPADGTLKLARRIIFLDQTLVNARHLSILF